MFGRFVHGNSSETGCCAPSKYRMRQSHRSLHEREVRRYRAKEKIAYISEILDDLQAEQQEIEFFYALKDFREDMINEEEYIKRESQYLEFDNINIVWSSE